jgi:hypothetical protein
MRLLAVLLLLPNLAFASIGEITQSNGSGVVQRDNDEFTIEESLGVESMDTVLTERGTARIDFVDDTRVDVTEHSKLIIDEFVYDPATGTGALSLKASLGTVRYASGQIAKNSRQSVNIRTPSATISVRGTDFAMTVDEIGGSTITLLPSCDTDGMCVTGEISVETDAGFVIMNQAFQATFVRARGMQPTKPVLLDINENDVNNLLIIRKPRPLIDAEEDLQNKKRLVDILDIDYLDIDTGLDEDMLLESIKDVWATDLSQDEYLLQDMLTDIFAQINEALMRLLMDEFEKYDEVAYRIDGFDASTGFYFEETDENWILNREDPTGVYLYLTLDNRYGYNINVFQGDFEYYDYRLGDSVSNTIDITQWNN